MRKVSEEVLDQLEFDKIIERAKSYAKGQDAIKNLEEIDFSGDFEIIQYKLTKVAELCEILSSPGSPSITVYENIDNDLFYLNKENYTLDSESVLRINDHLRNFQEIHQYFSGQKKRVFPLLAEYFDHTEEYVEYIKAIFKIFDEHGDVRPNASPELARIFRIISSKEKEIDKVFNRILNEYKSKGLLTENSESMKSGRRVLSLPSENKRIVKGVIHDESSSGKTVFIEPSGVIQINNELIELENEKRKEVFRILKDLSIDLRQGISDIQLINQKVIYFDILYCKAKVSLDLDAIKPELSPNPSLKLINAAHPLLKLKEKEPDAIKVVPFDLDLKGKNRILLISGPNAGGKTVTLKAVGLIHLMAYSGFLVPVDEGSVIGMFESLFTDIGDLQNLDDGLSTYSSHLSTMNEILKNANEKSLVLIDEFGSGTDPKIGGAIAESILRRFNFLGIFGVITTHYSNLKVFAYKEKGVVNGAMHFDEEQLKPTYRLMIGSPGSSYAFEVAQKIGLHPALIRYARKKVGKKEGAVDKLLVDLQREKGEYDERLLNIYDEKDRLDKLIKNYQQLNQELVIKRKKHKIRQKQDKIAIIEGERMKLDKVIKQLTEEKKLEDAKRIKEELSQKRKEEVERMTSIKKEIQSTENQDFEIESGSHVKFVDGEATGIVKRIINQKAEVLSGNMLITVPIHSLRPIKEQIEINGTRNINIVTVENQPVYSNKVDIRGYKYEDADRTLEEFLDGALLSNSNLLEVVHGKGNGVLRKLLLKKLKEYKDVKKVWHPDDGQGGHGTTLIKF